MSLKKSIMIYFPTFIVLSALCQSQAQIGKAGKVIVGGEAFKLCEEGNGPFEFGIRRFPDGGMAPPPRLSAIDNSGRYYINDRRHNRVLVFSHSGERIEMVDYSSHIIPGAGYGFDLKVTKDEILLISTWKSKARFMLAMRPDSEGKYYLEKIDLGCLPDETTIGDRTIHLDELFFHERLNVWWAIWGPGKGFALFTREGRYIRSVPYRDSYDINGNCYRVVSRRQQGDKIFKQIAVLDENGEQVCLLPGESIGQRVLRGNVYFKYRKDGEYYLRRFDKEGNLADEIWCRDIGGLPTSVSPNGAYLASNVMKFKAGRAELWVTPYYVRELP